MFNLGATEIPLAKVIGYRKAEIRYPVKIVLAIFLQPDYKFSFCIFVIMPVGIFMLKYSTTKDLGQFIVETVKVVLIKCIISGLDPEVSVVDCA